MILILTKDLAWLSSVGTEGLQSASRAIWNELVFVGSVFLVLLVVVISSFSRNINFFFENETSVLDSVTQGKLDRYVPVSTDDEFGIIATHTNLMIDGLRERNRIKNMFGKFLNPRIADVLLAQGEDELKFGGSQRDLVILVSDVRDFTFASETLTPEQTVTNLNIYFSRMVEIVHQNNGIVDKFVGDGMLAYFGLEDTEQAAARALRSAVQMQKAMEDVNKNLSSPYKIRIGLHSGEVIAGKIGSDEKLEFTVIGDVVNTASRLESLNENLDTAILMSDVVHNRLTLSELTLPWIDMGEQVLKGKGQAVKVYGIRYEKITENS
jgi:adenylate cyclase